MPSLWTLDIAGVTSRQALPSGIHRFLSEWFDESPQTHGAVKQYALRGRIDEPQGRGMRVVLGTTSDRLRESIAAIPPGLRVPFGASARFVGTVVDVPTLLTEATWADLAEPRAANQWRVWLNTPLAFRRDGIDQPWPAPYNVLASLLRRWPDGAAAPATATCLDRLARGIAVTEAEVRTSVCDWPPTAVWGAEGMLQWTWLGALADAAPIDSLIRLAEFTGVGAYPQYGLGSVTVDAYLAKPERLRHEAPRPVGASMGSGSNVPVGS